MTAAHNHAPRCCCWTYDPDTPDDGTTPYICPGCPMHGTFASASNPVECPQCHQAAGRPHTDYCPLQLADDPWTEVTDPPGYPVVCRKCFGYGQVDGKLCPVCVLPACTSPRTNHGDGRGCQADDCPRHGGAQQ